MSWRDDAAPLLELWRRAPGDPGLAARLARLASRHNAPTDARRWALEALHAGHPEAARLLARCDVPTLDLPDGTRVTRYALSDGALQPVVALACPAICLPDPDPRGVALTFIDAEEGGPRVYLYDPLRHSAPNAAATRIPVEEGRAIFALACTNTHVYASARRRDASRVEHAFGWRERDAPSAGWRWMALEAPRAGLFIERSGALLAVDDTAFARYALDAHPPTLLGRAPLPTHTTHERVIHGARGPRWMLLLSHGLYDGVASQFLALFDPVSLTEQVVVQHHLGPDGPIANAWHHAAWLDPRRALIAADAEGVYALDVGHPAVADAIAARDPRYAPRLMPLELMEQGALREVPFVESVDGVVVRVVVHPEAAWGVLLRPDGALVAAELAL